MPRHVVAQQAQEEEQQQQARLEGGVGLEGAAAGSQAAGVDGGWMAVRSRL